MSFVFISFNHTYGGHLNVIVKSPPAFVMSVLTSAHDMLVVLSLEMEMIDVPIGKVDM